MARILIIDDDEQVRELVNLYLTLDNHEVVTARDGLEGIKKIESGQFDLVITDIAMPEQDGLGVIMSQIGKPNRPKILAISGGSRLLDSSNLLKTATLLKADKALPKPVDYQTLKQAISELLTE